MSSTRAPRSYTASNATRLLSAGAYLEKPFRKHLIRELVRHRFRVVAPAYGYDVVTVLAHALAARALRRKQLAGTAVGWIADLILIRAGVISLTGFFLLALAVPWAFAFLRRAATMQALITRLPPVTGGTGEGDDVFPASPALTADLAEKIATEQAGTTDRIFYGGYKPFVGAGIALPDWSIAELLLPARPPVIYEYGNHEDAGLARPAAGFPPVKPFTVDEITAYVGGRLWSELHRDAPYGEQIENLTVERRRYSPGGLVPVKRRWLRSPLLLPPRAAAGAMRLVENREHYGAAREYLCVRVGSWDEELVISIFVGFDVRGNTLYSEFYPYVLPPVVPSFHLIDRLPARLTPLLLLRVAVGMPLGLPRDALRMMAGWLRRAWNLVWRRFRQLEGAVGLVDHSEFRLGRYAVELVDRGAVTSVRELAATPSYHVFFQDADEKKYVKIVERRLLQIIRDFLQEHNVDTGEHDRRGAMILDNSTHHYGEARSYGSGDIIQGGRRYGRS